MIFYVSLSKGAIFNDYYFIISFNWQLSFSQETQGHLDNQELKVNQASPYLHQRWLYHRLQTLLLKTKLPRFIARLMGIQRLQSPGVEQVIRNQFQAHIISWKSEKLRIMTREITFARPRAYWVRCKGRWSSLSSVSMLWRVKYLLLAVVTVMSFSLISYLTWCKSSRKDFN